MSEETLTLKETKTLSKYIESSMFYMSDIIGAAAHSFVDKDSINEKNTVELIAEIKTYYIQSFNDKYCALTIKEFMKINPLLELFVEAHSNRNLIEPLLNHNATDLLELAVDLINGEHLEDALK